MSEARADRLDQAGRTLCLDFANTLSGRTSSQPNDRLASYPELVAWARLAGILRPEKAEQLLANAELQPEAADAVLRWAIDFREALYRVFSASAGALPPMEADLGTLNEILAVAMSRLRLGHDMAGYGWTWAEGDELDQLLWPIARSAAELLTSGDLERVRECAGDSCNWLFLDMSKNRSRRWCDMNDCGNRAKARRHYQRVRAAAESG